MNIWLPAIIASSAPSGFADELPVAGYALRLNAANLATLWQDSALSTPATATTDPVGGWSDTSGNGYHAIQATSGSRPTLQLASMNGLPVLRFDGTDDYLLSALAHSGDELSVFMVARRIAFRGDGGGATFKPASGNDFDTAQGFISGYEGFGALTTFRASAGRAQVAHPGNGVAYVHSTIFDGASNAAQVNGGSVNTAGSTGTFNIVAVGIGARWRDGTWAFASSYFSNYDVAEFAVYPFALDSTERADVTAFLTTKWGL